MKYIKVGTYTFPLTKPFHVVYRSRCANAERGFYLLIDRKIVPLWSFDTRYYTTEYINIGENKREEVRDQVIKMAHLKIKEIIKSFLCGKEALLDLQNTLYSLGENWPNKFVKQLEKGSEKFRQSFEKIEISIKNVKVSKKITKHLEKSYVDENGEFLESEYEARQKTFKEETTEEITAVTDDPPHSKLKLVSNG